MGQVKKYKQFNKFWVALPLIALLAVLSFVLPRALTGGLSETCTRQLGYMSSSASLGEVQDVEKRASILKSCQGFNDHYADLALAVAKYNTGDLIEAKKSLDQVKLDEGDANYVQQSGFLKELKNSLELKTEPKSYIDKLKEQCKFKGSPVRFGIIQSPLYSALLAEGESYTTRAKAYVVSCVEGQRSKTLASATAPITKKLRQTEPS